MSLESNAQRLADQLDVVLAKADRADAENAALREQLSPQEIRVLRTVGGMECPIMSAIAGAIRLSLSSATGLIDRLCEKRLVRRDRSPEDRRVVQVGLTDEGKRLHERARQSRVAFARDVLSALAPAEQEQLVALLGKASDKLKEEHAR